MRGGRRSFRKVSCPMVWMLTIWIAATPLWMGQPVAADSNTVYFAQMADGGGYITQIVLANPSTADVTAVLELFKSDGSLLSVILNGTTSSSFNLTVKARGALFLKTSGAGAPTVIGWVRVKATSALGGSLTYSNLPGGKVLSEAGLDPSAPATRFCYTVDTLENYYSGLAVVNPNSTALEMRYALYDSNGNLKAQSTYPLGPMQHSARLLGEIFPNQNLKDFTGMVTVISSSGPVVAATLHFDPAVETLTSIPVITGPAITTGNPGKSH